MLILKRRSVECGVRFVVSIWICRLVVVFVSIDSEVRSKVKRRRDENVNRCVNRTMMFG